MQSSPPANDLSSSLCKLDYMGFIRISGEQATQLMQGQFSCDVNNVTPAKSVSGVHCNPKGRIISLFRLFQINEDYYLLLPKNNIKNTLEALKKYAMFFKAEVCDATEELWCFACSGKDMIDRIANTDAKAITTIPLDPRLDDDKVFVIANKDALQAEVAEPSYWKYLTIQSGIPEVYAETCEKLLPHNINLQNIGALNFKKGCYTGQEIIARMEYLGKPKQALYKLVMSSNTDILPGDIINDAENKQAGIVIDSCIYNNTQHVLATLKLANLENKKLNINNIDIDSHAHQI